MDTILLFRRFVFVAFVAISSWQALPAHAQSARELDDRVRRLEQQIQTLAASRGVTTQQLPAQGREEAADLQARVIKLEQLVEQLTGQIEEARFKTGQMSTQLEQLSNDVNYRLAVLEQSLGTQGGAAPQMPPPPRANGPQTPRPAPALQPTVPDDPNVLSRPVSPGPRSQAPVTPPPMADGSVRASTPGDSTFGTLRTDQAGRAISADPNQPSVPPSQTATPLPKQPAPQRASTPASTGRCSRCPAAVTLRAASRSRRKGSPRRP